MQQSDFPAFKVILDATAELYGKPLSEAVIVMWWEALKGYDLPAVRVALSRHVQNPDTGQFMPKPADVIRMLGGTTQDTALAAWAKVDAAVRGVGTYESVVFDDPIIHAVIADMGGWVQLGTRGEKDWPFIAREFENRYRGYRTRGAIEHYPPVLTGLAQLHNEAQNLPVAEPVLVGDAQQAQKTRLFGRDVRAMAWHRAGQVSTTPHAEQAHRHVAAQALAARND